MTGDMGILGGKNKKTSVSATPGQTHWVKLLYSVASNKLLRRIFPIPPPVPSLLEVEEKPDVLLAFYARGKVLLDFSGFLGRDIGIDEEKVEILQFRGGAFRWIWIVVGQRFFLLYATGGHTKALRSPPTCRGSQASLVLFRNFLAIGGRYVRTI